MSTLLNSIAILISSGVGTGFSPKASGTVASLACAALVFLAAALSNAPVSLSTLLCTAIAASAAGMWSTSHLLKIKHPLLLQDRNIGTSKEGDPHMIVIDEWAGMLFALLGASTASWIECLAAFFLFRAFDIMKPGPIGWAERLPGATGIMLDDILAGIASALVMLAMGQIF